MLGFIKRGDVILIELLEKFDEKYRKENVAELLEMERTLRFDSFDSLAAFSLGEIIVQLSSKYQEGLCVSIIRESDQLVIFQYVSDSCSKRNIDFAMKKRNTVLLTGHCSLWALVQEVVDKNVAVVFEEGSECLPVGGSFPIYVGENIVATISISGLKNGQDHQIIVDAVSTYLNKQVSTFTGELI